MQQQQTSRIIQSRRVNLWRALSVVVAVSFITLVAQAAKFDVIADTPASFRANFTGMDTNPESLGDGNDFQMVVFDFWTVLVNLRGDSVDSDGNAFGFYEIQLYHTGKLTQNPNAPKLDASLSWGPLSPIDVLSDKEVDTEADTEVNIGGSDYLSTTTNITYDPVNNIVNYSGSIAGDSDLNGDGTLDSQQTDNVVQTLLELKKSGAITGSKMGEILKETNKYTK
jgi:hypothetical protein